MSSSDEEKPKCDSFSIKHESHECEPIDLSIHATRDAASHSGGQSIINLPVSVGYPSDRQPVGSSDLPGPQYNSVTKTIHFQEGSRASNHLSSFVSNQRLNNSSPLECG
ncbi:hypothetical protein NPIL_5881 [Nephila pilipes]|uniref:Uncharacterized protein n=1 Tax=Nephila pilipes TaxID=299642 RepID=A0A8X6P0I3_NEPPI|nr:hypothetical protein NPIL_5881 [Nephila pilipes]